MGWYDYIDTSTSTIDDATLGDVPQFGGDFGGGDITYDYGSGVGSGFPNLTVPGGLTAASNALGWGGNGGGYVTQTGAVGGAAMALGGAAVGMAARIAPQVFNAIVKLSARLGGASGSVLGYGRKVWASLSAWSAKNPGVSLMVTLTSLGLSIEEAAHFIAWGATSKRRRRTRGITGRDIKTTRRTIRKLNSMRHLFTQLCAGAVRHRRKHA